MSYHSGLIVQRKKSPIWYATLSIVAGVLIACAAFLGHQIGNRERDAQLLEIARINEKLSQQDAVIEEQRLQIEKQMAQIGMLRAEQQATGNSEAKAFETIAELQEEVRQLKKDLAFYRNVMSPDTEQQGLQIEKFVAERALSSDDIKFRLSLIQTKKHTSYLSGSVEIAFVGDQDGQAKTVELASISDSPDALKFRFKYLQHISGAFTLPDGFNVKSVRVSAKVKGRRKITVDKEFPWQITETNSNVEQQAIQKQAES